MSCDKNPLLIRIRSRNREENKLLIRASRSFSVVFMNKQSGLQTGCSGLVMKEK